MTKRVIRTDQAPAPFQGAPYSQGIANGGFVFVSGQLGVDPGGNMVEGGISEQTEQVMKNLSAILEAAGTSLENVVKATIFLVDLGDFQAMNEVYGRQWARSRRRAPRSRLQRCLPARSSRSKLSPPRASYGLKTRRYIVTDV